MALPGRGTPNSDRTLATWIPPCQDIGLGPAVTFTWPTSRTLKVDRAVPSEIRTSDGSVRHGPIAPPIMTAGRSPFARTDRH